VKVVKNKVAPPFREAIFDILYGAGISRQGEIIELGVNHGIVDKSGAWYAYNGEKIYCRREAPMGSRISSGQHCGTVAELATTTQEGRQGLERSQRNTVSPMPH
ncbi:MAG: hypothetical protein JOY74_07405, partial [Sinobacteraceae bacterium]|nr:hypothetical protein [Nevskiaceae bacterium]